MAGFPDFHLVRYALAWQSGNRGDAEGAADENREIPPQTKPPPKKESAPVEEPGR